MQTMTRQNPRWDEFLNELVDRLNVEQCTSKTDRPIANVILQTMDVDVDASLAYFDSRGGYCDCEILMNV